MRKKKIYKIEFVFTKDFKDKIIMFIPHNLKAGTLLNLVVGKKVLEDVGRGILKECLKCNEFKKEVNPFGICIPCCKKLQKKYGIKEELEEK